jgi:hypothetical protein
VSDVDCDWDILLKRRLVEATMNRRGEGNRGVGREEGWVDRIGNLREFSFPV